MLFVFSYSYFLLFIELLSENINIMKESLYSKDIYKLIDDLVSLIGQQLNEIILLYFQNNENFKINILLKLAINIDLK